MTKLTSEQAAMITELANDFRPVVAEIEKSIKTTQNHYGKYMAIIGELSQGNRGIGAAVALALIQAGANQAGVDSALKLSF